ncbi:hypothetical protein JIG36_14430 [Actinoplanes sp. LDG1-06]|uniref:Uncharacterized protein n=1 Tax=Paractinoplanes ovalisporus TaxID=2810368 RepID=A0ABS2AA88_9ACTN|nr:hypothetical protein [Actinoplanes ovalisporus]MBM2616756.1 hypothetical protein [Actinoplanes ovalisporus]
MTYPQNVDLETPTEDAVEQSTEAFRDYEDEAQNPPELSVETPEWDAQDRSEVVHGDDEYR